MALPNIKNPKMEWLQRCMSESLLYVSLVEKILDSKADLVNIRNAAESVWLGVDLFRKWLDEDLRKIALEGKTSKETLERLADIAKTIVMEFKETNMNGKENPLNSPKKVIAANSMHRTSQTLLLDMVAEILGACLTNLPRVITMKCFCSAIEEREKSVQCAAHLLGETEEILELLQQRELPSLNPDQAANINEWRALIISSSSNNGSPSSGSSEFNITIE